MDCAHCAQTIQTGVQQLVGVQTCELNFTTGTLHVQGDIQPEQVQAKVEALGYAVVTDEGAAASSPSSSPSLLTYLWSRPDTRLALGEASSCSPASSAMNSYNKKPSGSTSAHWWP
jgi:copper chaperone CopZ